ncbi:MAG: hypothetical protein MH204_03575 [Fimbriimonadaceae bacterium]|nr:hypothetical protein [Fimbriimonadaceae bacterium]
MLLGLILAAMAPAPVVELGSLLRNRFFLADPEPRWMLSHVSVNNAPAGDFQVQVVVKSGETTLGEVEGNRIFRAENMASVQLKSRQIPLGTAPGLRRIEVRVNGQPAGGFDFQLGRSGDQWTVMGPWHDHGQMRWIPGGNASARVRFDWWAAGVELSASDKPFKAVFKRGGKVIAEGTDKYPSKNMWVYRSDNLRLPDRSFLGASEIASKLGAGPFVVEIVQEGRTLKSYRGSVEGNGFKAHVRSGPNPPEGKLALPDRDLSEGSTKITDDRIAWLAP